MGGPSPEANEPRRLVVKEWLPYVQMLALSVPVVAGILYVIGFYAAQYTMFGAPMVLRHEVWLYYGFSVAVNLATYMLPLLVLVIGLRAGIVAASHQLTPAFRRAASRFGVPAVWAAWTLFMKAFLDWTSRGVIQYTFAVVLLVSAAGALRGALNCRLRDLRGALFGLACIWAITAALTAVMLVATAPQPKAADVSVQFTAPIEGLDSTSSANTYLLRYVAPGPDVTYFMDGEGRLLVLPNSMIAVIRRTAPLHPR